VQELWVLIQDDQESESLRDTSDQDGQLHMLLSQEALAVGGDSKTLKF
jgi:hypothetical protein